MKKRKAPGCLTIIVLLLMLGVYASVRNNVGPSVQISKIEGVSAEQNEKIAQVLEKIGVKSYMIEHDEMLDEEEGEGSKGYRISGTINGTNSKNIIVYTDSTGNLLRVRWADKDFYKDGKTVAVLTDYFLTDEEEIMLKTQAEIMVKDILAAPSTAKFPGYAEYVMEKTPDKYIVGSYVDAQNGFGAMLRSEFMIRISRKDNKVLSFIFDGKELVK
ncbi:hypothetical protein [Filifactor villosus]|uniref:Uncharacterized protein n=1 Tax=Filifactor villosus TaxID=29374 RepID=A0ABV9QN43_9FIRM